MTCATSYNQVRDWRYVKQIDSHITVSCYCILLCSVMSSSNVIMYGVSGGEGRFYVDSMSGEVRVLDRAQFNLTAEYKLGVSAQCVGSEAALSVNTPAQSVTVLVEDVDPQFYSSPYMIGVPENTAAGAR